MGKVGVREVATGFLMLLAASLVGCDHRCEGEAAAKDPKCLRTGVESVPPPAQEPGFLVLMCQPSCDDVTDEGRSLGPAPIVKAPLAPGVHKLALKNGNVKKNLNVEIVSGQSTAERIQMDAQ